MAAHKSGVNVDVNVDVDVGEQGERPHYTCGCPEARTERRRAASGAVPAVPSRNPGPGPPYSRPPAASTPVAGPVPEIRIRISHPHVHVHGTRVAPVVRDVCTGETGHTRTRGNTSTKMELAVAPRSGYSTKVATAARCRGYLHHAAGAGAGTPSWNSRRNRSTDDS